MAFVTPIVPVTPMRLEASHRSEMVSQLLFGESASIIEKGKDFIKVSSLYDDYIGWIQKSQLVEISDEQALKGNGLLNAEILRTITCNGTTMRLSFGCPLHFFEYGCAKIGDDEFHSEGKFWNPAEAQFNEAALQWVAQQFLNTAYLWGGRSIFGIDCSGLTQQIFRFLGIFLPRDAYQQAALGELVGFLQEAKCGDLAFFENTEGRITHVGMMLDNASIIHASGKVRIDPIDNMGIIHSETGARTHQLRFIKRYQP